MARILAGHDALVPHEYAAHAPASLRFFARVLGRAKGSEKTLSPGVRLALALEQMGPSAIKLGQLLATRPDILGPEVARGLETLQDRLPPFPEAEARRIIELELARPLEKIFAAFGPPVAAASIAQVHEAETTDDPPRHVAVKILRPGIEADFVRDFEAFRLAADVAERFSAEGRRLRLRTLVETLAASVALELDLRMEGAAASELAQNTRGDDAFHVPAIDWSRTSHESRRPGGRVRCAMPKRSPPPSPIQAHRLRIGAADFFLRALRDGFSTPRHPETCFVLPKAPLRARIAGASVGCAASAKPWRGSSHAITCAWPRCSSTMALCPRSTMSKPSPRLCARSASRFSG
jgi:ubiquinone biosynthesis protein